MAIKYVLHENPVAPGKVNDGKKHARVFHTDKLDLDSMYELISARSSMSSADVKSVLDSFQFILDFYLKEGITVELPELGHFYPTLKSQSFIDEKGKQKIKVTIDTVGFRCSPKLKKKLRSTPLEEEKRPQRNPYSFEKRKERILREITEEGSINSSRTMRLNACTRHTALDDLKKMTTAGDLFRAGSGRTSVYLLPPKG